MKPPRPPSPSPTRAQTTPAPQVRASLRLLGLLLALAPWAVAPAAFSFDTLDELKSLVVAAGLTLCLFLLLREELRRPPHPLEPLRFLAEPFRAGALMILGGLLLSALCSPVPGLGLLSALPNLLYVAFALCLALRPPAAAELRWLLLCLFATMILQSLLALAQYFFPRFVEVIAPFAIPARAGRDAMIGTLGNPEYLAGWLAAGLGAALLILGRGTGGALGGAGRTSARDPLWLASAALAALAFSVIFIGGSRGALLATLGALLLAWAATGRRPRAHDLAPTDDPNAPGPGSPSAASPTPEGLNCSVAPGDAYSRRTRRERTRGNPSAPFSDPGGVEPPPRYSLNPFRRLPAALLASACLLGLLFLIWAFQSPFLRKSTLPGRLVELTNLHSPSMHHRIGLLAVTSAIIREHPLLGVGPGRFGWAYSEMQGRLANRESGIGYWALGEVLTGNYVGEAHCDPLQWWAEFGLLPLLGLTLMIARALAGTAQSMRRSPPDSNPSPPLPADNPLGAAVWIALAALALDMWVAFPLQRPIRALTFWVLLGLVAGLLNATQKEEEPQP